MIPTNTAIAIGVGTLMVIVILVTLMTGSIFAAAVVVALIVLLFVVMVQYGFLHVKVSGDEIDIFFQNGEPKSIVPDVGSLRPVNDKEVFHVSDNRFNQDEAPAVCAAQGGELATQDQVDQAQEAGAEWCGYGWSAGGIALFPTQKATWERLQGELDPAKRTACGRPGVNGGQFDPTLKFGVNCQGKKPAGKLSLTPPGSDSAFAKMVQMFKDQISGFKLSGYNRSQWSAQGSQFKDDTSGMNGSDGAVDPHPPKVNSGTDKGAPSAQGGLIFKAVQVS